MSDFSDLKQLDLFGGTAYKKEVKLRVHNDSGVTDSEVIVLYVTPG